MIRQIMLFARGRGLGPLLATAALVVFGLVPAVAPLTPLGMKAVGVFLATVILWVSVGTGYPSFLCIALLALTGVMSPTQAFASSMGHWIVLFLLGCFGMSHALRTSGFSTRVALWFLTRPFARGRPWMLLALFLLACTLTAAVMSSTVTAIIFLAIATPMLETLGYRKGDSFAALVMMGIAWTATAATAMTPIAHASNLTMIEWLARDFGRVITFPQWMLVGVPIGLVTYVVILAVFRFVIRPDAGRFDPMASQYIRDEVAGLGRVKREELVSVGVFAAVVICWMLPDLAAGAWPALASYLRGLGYATPALFGAAILCFLTVRGKPLLTFSDWMGRSVEWGSVALVAAIMALGDVVADPATGIPEFLTATFAPLATNLSTAGFLVLVSLWVVLQTNVMSNFVSMALVYNTMAPLAAATDLADPVALGVVLAVASRYAFCLPAATVVTALVIGSGWVPVRFMLRYGALLILPIVLLSAFVFYPFIHVVLR